MDNNKTNNMNQDVNTQTNENLNQQPTVVQPEASIATTEPVPHQETVVKPTQTIETPVELVKEENQAPEQTEVPPQQAPVAPQPQMYQQQVSGVQQPKKKFNWVLWIAVAAIIPIAIGVILTLVGNSIASGGEAEIMPLANFIKALGTLAMYLLTPPCVIIVVIIGIIKSNKN